MNLNVKEKITICNITDRGSDRDFWSSAATLYVTVESNAVIDRMWTFRKEVDKGA